MCSSRRQQFKIFVTIARKLRHQLSNLTRHKIAFPVGIVKPWNKLPPEAVDSASEEIFKRRLDGVLDTLSGPLPSLNIQHCFFNLSFLPFVQMSVRGYLARKCHFLDH